MPAPIIFKSEKARNFLLKHGIVITFRPKCDFTVTVPIKIKEGW